MQPMMIVLRLFHVVSGILWVGGVAVLTMFLTPAVRGAGPAGGAVMRHLLTKTRFIPYFPALGGLTVLTGILLFWRDGVNTQGGAAAFGASGMGITLSIGGLAGLIALLFGGLVVGRAAGQASKILRTVEGSGGQPSPEQGAALAALQAKIGWGSRIVLPILIIAAIAMAVARYV